MYKSSLLFFSNPADDNVGSGVDIVVWSIIETYTAVICACLMTLRPLVAKFMPSNFQSSTLVSDTSWPYSIPHQHRTLPLRQTGYKSRGPGWDNKPESAVKLNSLENDKAWAGGKSSYDGGHGIEGSLEEVTGVQDNLTFSTKPPIRK